jgi:very long chain acyl-CoA dehydrogenase
MPHHVPHLPPPPPPPGRAAGTNEILRLFVALTCMQTPGAQLSEWAKKVKNPLTAPAALAEMGMKHVKRITGWGVDPVPGAHASLSAEAAAVAAAVLEFNHAVEALLVKHGKGIIEQQLQAQRIANASIDLYGCLSVLSRATASISQGGATVEHETLLARTAIARALARIRDNLRGVHAGGKRNGDDATIRIAQDVLTAGKYLAPHPLRV